MSEKLCVRKKTLAALKRVPLARRPIGSMPLWSLEWLPRPRLDDYHHDRRRRSLRGDLAHEASLAE